MSSDNIKQLYNLRENDPQKAIELARVPGPGPGERVNRPGFTGGQNFRRIAHYGTVTQQEDLEAVFT